MQSEKKILLLSHLFYAKISFSSKIVDNYHPISYSSMNHANNSDANFELMHSLCYDCLLHAAPPAFKFISDRDRILN